MALIVKKFGGTSVSNIHNIRLVSDIIRKESIAGNKVVVVVSAMGHTTDQLLEYISEISSDSYNAECDVILSSGEQITSGLLALMLQKNGIRSRSFAAWQIPIISDHIYGRSSILNIDTSILNNAINENTIPIIAGYQSINEHLRITTLGRGGSDTSAVAVAIALQADRCDIYTDVNGVYTADPNIVSNAQFCKSITYDEMLELASMGAQIMHNKAVEIAMLNDLKLRIRSTFNTENDKYTELTKNQFNTNANNITGVTSTQNESQISIISAPDSPEILSNIFKVLDHNNININMIVKNYDAFGMMNIIITTKDADLAFITLNNHKKMIQFQSLSKDENIAIVSIVGSGMMSKPGIANKMFECLYQNAVKVHAISTSEIKISVIIPKDKVNEIVLSLHEVYFH